MFSITLIIIIITAIISISAFYSHELMKKWIFSPYVVKANNEYHRFLTSGFLHADWMHLLVNMLVLYFFGNNVEQSYIALFDIKGYYYFILLYLGAIIISELSTYKKHLNNPGYMSLGASGATSAVLFASILIFPVEKVCLWGIICIPGFIMGILYLYYSARMAKGASDHINHEAHFYGAVFGMIYTLILKPALFVQFIQQIIEYISDFLG